MVGSEGDLVRRAQQGDRSALSALLTDHVGSVRACVLTVLGPTPDLEDLIQEALLRAVEGLDRLRDPERFGPWIRTLTRHLCIDRIRRKRPALSSLDGVAEPAARGEAEPSDHGELWRAIEQLPEKLREAIVLFYVSELSYAEIGTRLEITPAAVNRRLTRARSSLRERLAGVKEER